MEGLHPAESYLRTVSRRQKASKKKKTLDYIGHGSYLGTVIFHAKRIIINRCYTTQRWVRFGTMHWLFFNMKLKMKIVFKLSHLKGKLTARFETERCAPAAIPVKFLPS
jgi:hypothetical protein